MDTHDYIDHLSEHLASGRSNQMPEADILPMLQALEKASRLITAVSHELATQAEQRSLHVRHGCRDIAALLRGALNLTPHEARRRGRLVHELPALPSTQQALREGEITLDHALAVSDVLRALPATLPVEVTDDAEKVLAEQARFLNHKELQKAGKHLRAVLDQDGTLAEENEGIAKRFLRVSQDARGWVHLTGCLDPEGGEAFRTAIHALSKPQPADGDADLRSTDQRQADALVALTTQALQAGDLPKVGGERPHISVTIDYADLRDGLSSGWASWGGPMTAKTIRRMACDAKIIPVVLDTMGIPLDVGQAQRTVTGPLRTALAVRDKGCAFPGCTMPAAWADAHHVIHWSEGGPTALCNTVLLCRHHHTVIHDGDWEVEFDHDGLPVFIPPSWVDPQRQPRRNIRTAWQTMLPTGGGRYEVPG
ncbi:DUF222 domain-containing protein [Allokutzneria oryzae]|uniref:DUF222 domain-containing protein n=1 Tax=Allokutzneria oryzae TaxID=1378989 RepID=A0ABV5ZXT3_9PSEU